MGGLSAVFTHLYWRQDSTKVTFMYFNIFRPVFLFIFSKHVTITQACLCIANTTETSTCQYVTNCGLILLPTVSHFSGFCKQVYLGPRVAKSTDDGLTRNLYG